MHTCASTTLCARALSPSSLQLPFELSDLHSGLQLSPPAALLQEPGSVRFRAALSGTCSVYLKMLATLLLLECAELSHAPRVHTLTSWASVFVLGHRAQRVRTLVVPRYSHKCGKQQQAQHAHSTECLKKGADGRSTPQMAAMTKAATGIIL